MTAFSLNPAQVEAATTYEIAMAVQAFWRANGFRQQNLTNGEYRAEALHWASR